MIDAIDKDENFLNFLNVTATIVSPNMEATELQFRQTASGRYVAEVETPKEGSYFLTVVPGPGHAAIRTGISVPYSAEFRDRQTNRELLKNLAASKPKEGTPGRFRDDAGGSTDAKDVNSFRRDLAEAVSANFVWPWLLLVAGCLFFTDVFVRRVAISFQWIGQGMEWIKRRWRHEESAPEAEIARLRSRKAQVASEIEQRQAGTRYEADPEAEIDISVLNQSSDTTAKQESPQSQHPSTTEPEDDAFTSRLLKAKKEARKDQNKDKR